MNSKTNTTPRFIDLYYEWMEKGELPEGGLCFSFPDYLLEDFELFHPTHDDLVTLRDEGLIDFVSIDTNWAAGVRSGTPGRDKFLSPLRQHIILFCAAINDEL